MKIPIEKVNANVPQHEEYLWQYVNLHKFLSFITRRQFHYSRLDVLEDALEGIHQRDLALLSVKRRLSDKPVYNPKHKKFNIENYGQEIEKMEKKLLRRQSKYLVNCWFMSNRESVAMWNLYSAPGSVAIKVSIKNLISFIENKNYTFTKRGSIKKISYGMVRYVDYLDPEEVNKKTQPYRDTAFRKDISFQHEKEFRIALQVTNSGHYGLDQIIKDIKELQLKVYYHPKTEDWQKEVLKEMLQRLHISVPIKNSELTLK